MMRGAVSGRGIGMLILGNHRREMGEEHRVLKRERFGCA
jgi:hypothetical protein